MKHETVRRKAGPTPEETARSLVITERVLILAEQHISEPGHFNSDLRREFRALLVELRRETIGHEGLSDKKSRAKFAENSGLKVSKVTELEVGTGIVPGSSTFFVKILEAHGVLENDMARILERYYPVTEDTELRKLVKTLMALRRMTQEELAQRSGVKPHILDNLVRGRIKESSLKTLGKLADALDLDGIDASYRDSLMAHVRPKDRN